jgi:ATP-dependent helicase HepA
MFLIMDEKQFKSNIRSEPEKNPFFNSQTILSPIEWVLSSKIALDKACESNWDHLIIDEAHHLEWHKNGSSAEYQVVARLAGKTEGLLLITATPTQLDQEAHFGRLKLLDPVRFHNYSAYLKETAFYRKTAALCNDILSEQKPPTNFLTRVRHLFPKDKILLESAASLRRSPSKQKKESFIQDLLDRHGTGRLVYRNRRSVIKGFPEKKLYEVKLSAPEKFRQQLAKLYTAWKDRQNPLFFDALELAPANLKLPPAEGDLLLQAIWQADPRLSWLVDFLRQMPKGEKLLVICSSPDKVLTIQKILPRLIKTAFCVFHEHLTLSARDKNAADFSRPEGVKMMISSEIGSEGRNFQFARNLVLLDLPPSPALLEQRIGRIHRIGQTGTSLIYSLFIEHTPAQLLFRWYHAGLNSFTNQLPVDNPACKFWFARINPLARALLEGKKLGPILQEKFEDIIKKTRAEATHLALQEAKGRDRLLEIHSFQITRARKMMESASRLEKAPHLENFLEKVFDAYGVEYEQTAEKRGYFIFPGAGMAIDAFPELPDSGLHITYDRKEALLREDMVFMTWDHPLVAGAWDLILENTENTICAVEWQKSPEKGLLSEFIFVLEFPPAPSQRLFGEMPPTVIKILLDCQQRERPDLAPFLDKAKYQTGAQKFKEQYREFTKDLWPDLLKTGRRLATEKAEKLKKNFKKTLMPRLESEKARLLALKGLQSGNTTLAEKKFFQVQMEINNLIDYLGGGHIRMDAVRFILMT